MAKQVAATVSIVPLYKSLLKAEADRIKSGDKATKVIGGIVTEMMDQWAIAGIPKTEDGVKLINKTIADARESSKGDKNSVFLSGHAGFSKSTFDNYLGGAKRCYVAGVAWTATAFRAPDKGGAPAFPWGKGAKAAGRKVKAPSKGVTTSPKVTAKTLNAEITRLLGEVRKIKGDQAADTLVDAFLRAIPGFKIVA